MTKLLILANLRPGMTGGHRAAAFSACGIDVVATPTCIPDATEMGLVARLRWKMRLPVDLHRENSRLLQAAAEHRPEIVFVDNSSVITRATLLQLRAFGVCRLAFYSPDDITAPHNMSRQVEATFDQWDALFTTKTICVPELSARGVRRPILVGNSFELAEHRPMTPDEVGPEWERFDFVFVGTCEHERATSIRSLAEAGLLGVVYGNDAGRLSAGWGAYAHPNLTFRPAAVAENYAKALHKGKVALCFLRKKNRDQITTRSIEIPGTGRAMLAEKTDEHDQHFLDGREYLGFRNQKELLEGVRALVADRSRREAIGAAGRARCISSNYDTISRARQMLEHLTLGESISAMNHEPR